MVTLTTEQLYQFANGKIQNSDKNFITSNDYPVASGEQFGFFSPSYVLDWISFGTIIFKLDYNTLGGEVFEEELGFWKKRVYQNWKYVNADNTKYVNDELGIKFTHKTLAEYYDYNFIQRRKAEETELKAILTDELTTALEPFKK